METTIFGTDGIRRKVGLTPLTHKDVTKIGKSIALWAKEKYGRNPTILIGHDTRESCQMLKAALKTGLLLHTVKIYDANIVPTPTVVAIAQDNNFDCGIVISASHNLHQDNGIKIIDAKTGKLSKKDEERITELFYDKKIESDDYLTFGKDITFENAKKQYKEIITSYFDKNLLSGLKIVLDCANGATSDIAPKIFESLGATVIAIAKNSNGKNINKNCGSLFPQSLQKAVIENSADIGFAFDGDGDRLTAVSKDGKIKDGDDILAILIDNPVYKKENQIVGTIVTNYGIEKYLQSKGKKLIRTKVGDKFVAKAMQENKLLLGAEQSGHIVLGDYLSVSDGIFAAVRTTETIKLTGNFKMETFEKYPQFKINLPVKEKRNLTSPTLANLITKNENKLIKGRIIVRYSGTENVLRVMVEEQNNELTQKICIELSNELKKELG